MWYDNPFACLLTLQPKCERLTQPKFRAVEGLLASARSISLLISAAEQGDRAAGEILFEVLYSELHRLAKCELARRGVPVSLGATTLLHQAYIEMAGQERTSFPDQARFMGYAARVMRGL